MLLHLRAVDNQMYVKSENELRMHACSATAGRYEAFYVSCPTGIHDRSPIEIRAVADNVFLGLDHEGYLGAGRAPKLVFAVQKVGGKPGTLVEDGDIIALRKPRAAWLPWQQYVRVCDGAALHFGKGSRSRDAEFVFVKAREILHVEVPGGTNGVGTIKLKDLPAPVGGVPIEMESNHPEILTVQKSVSVPEGQIEATFAFSRQPYSGSGDFPSEVSITALALATGYSVTIHVPAVTPQLTHV